MSQEGIGPTVIKPGEAMMVKIAGKMPDAVRRLVSAAAAQVEVGVRFRAFDKHGAFPNEGKLFRYTIWKFEDGRPVAATPIAGGNDQLMDLL